MKVAIHVQHLLGAGHLVRAMSLAEALARHGCEVLLLSGGFPIERPVAGYRLVQLPPARAQGQDFTRLFDVNGIPVDDAWRQHRAEQLLQQVRAFRPQLLITETFPFGRRQFRFELDPLIEWARQQSSLFLLASVRDVLQRRSEKRNRQTVETLKQYYDAVLVHADETLFRLDASFPLSHEIADQLLYTGYIYQGADALNVRERRRHARADRSGDGWGEIIVSGGSGTVSARLLETAQRARSLGNARNRVWRLLTGRDRSGPPVQPREGLVLEPNRPDFYSLLCRCELSISQAGYNTTLDVLASGARSVMVPFSGDGETEQSDRARALESAGRVLTVAESELAPRKLAYAVNRALEREPVALALNIDGADRSARIIMQRYGGGQDV